MFCCQWANFCPPTGSLRGFCRRWSSGHGPLQHANFCIMLTALGSVLECDFSQCPTFMFSWTSFPHHNIPSCRLGLICAGCSSVVVAGSQSCDLMRNQWKSLWWLNSKKREFYSSISFLYLFLHTAASMRLLEEWEKKQKEQEQINILLGVVENKHFRAAYSKLHSWREKAVLEDVTVGWKSGNVKGIVTACRQRSIKF